jgi:hypothetical protein
MGDNIPFVWRLLIRKAYFSVFGFADIDFAGSDLAD